MPSPVETKDLGLHVIRSPQPGSASVTDVVAVHGMGAHPHHTWCKRVKGPEKPRPLNKADPSGQAVASGSSEWADSKYVNWLEDEHMLPAVLPNARLMRYGYESSCWGPDGMITRPDDIGQRLLYALAEERKECHYRPLIFISHSYGGLVVLQTILNAKEQQQGYKGLYLSVVGTIFFGVPFRGTSDTLSQGEILARAESIHGPEHVYRDNYQLLRRDDEHMQLLLSRYLRAVWDDKLPPRAFCFYERKKTDIGALLGPSFKGQISESVDILVNQNSGSLEPNAMTESCSRACDHFEINKFAEPQEEDFRRLAAVLRDMAQTGPDTVKRRTKPLSSEPFGTYSAQADTIGSDIRPRNELLFPGYQWRTSLESYEKAINAEDYEQVMQSASIDDCQASARLVTRKLATNAHEQLQSFFSRLSNLVSVIGLFASAEPEATHLVYGAVSLALEQASRRKATSLEIMGMLPTLGELLPRLDESSLVSPTAPQVQEALISIYSDLLGFCAKVHRSYSQSGAYWVYAYVTGGLDLGFESTVSSLRAHRKAFDVGSSSDQSLTDAQKDHKTTNGGLSVISVAREPETSAAKYGLFPYPPNPNFEGREMILQQVHERIHHPRRHQYPGMVRSTALHGLGGIGKTQIALRYVYTHQGSYDAIFWVSADNETKLSKGYDDIAKVLKLKASELEDQREIVREVKHWLQQTTESWLIVFDNVEFDGTSGIEIFRNYWPASAIQGSVLVTTRNRGSVVSLGSKVLEIQPLQEGEAIKVFYANLLSPPPSPIDGDSGDHASAVKLVRELGGLPLAITQASAYINRQRSTVEAYYKKFIAVDDSLDMLSDTSDTTYELKTVTTTWNISFEQIRGSNSAVLLNVLALLDPDGVPESVFTAGGSAIDTNDRHHVFMHDEWRYEDSVGTLAQYALLSRQHKSLYTHRLVQQVSLRRMSADDVVCAYEAATRLVWKVFPASDRSSLWPHWAAAARYLSQALRLEMHYQRYRESTGTGRPATHVAELFTQCGKYLRERSLFEQSIRFLEVARDTQESRNGRMHLATASCYYALGRSYLDLMQLDKAISHFKIAAEVQTSLLGENDRTTANSLNDMGIAYHESGELDEAERLYRVRLAVYERLLGPDDPYTASSLNNLAMIALARGDWAQGVTLTRRSLAIQEHALGNDHPYLPKTRNYLAFCLRAAGELEEAAKLHQLALAYQELKLGKQHVSTATSLQGLADVYHDQGHFDDALDLYLQVFRIRRETLKVQHPDRVGASKNLIMLLCKLNRMDQAEACIADIEQEAVAELGPEHELIINALLAPGRSLILECSKDIESFKSLPLEGRYVQHQH